MHVKVLNWLLDARQTRGGKCIAAILAVVLAFSFINLTSTVGVAVASETEAAQSSDVVELLEAEVSDVEADADEEGVEEDAEEAEVEKEATEGDPETEDEELQVQDTEDESDEAAVAEVDGTKFETLQEAITAVYYTSSKTATVKLLQDTAIANDVNALKIWKDCTITLDLGGNTIYGAIWNYGDLVITGSGIVSNTRNDNAWPAVENRGTLTIESGSFIAKGTNYALGNYDGNDVTINGGTFQGVINSAGTMLITGGMFKSCYNGASINGLINWDGSVTINGGTFVSDADCPIQPIQNLDEMIINDATVTAQQRGVSCVGVQDYGDNKGNLTVNGGIFTANVDDDADMKGKGVFLNIYAETDPVLYGGTYNKDVSAYCGEGAGIVDNGDGTYTVIDARVAAIGDVRYASLQAAINAAQDGDTVTLLSDIAETGIVKSGKEFTLDLNGKVLANGQYAITLQNQGILTIVDSSADQTGMVVSYANDDAIDNYGTLNVEAGRIQGGSAWYAIYGGANSTTNVYGTAKVCGTYWGICASDVGARINVSGDAEIWSTDPSGTNGGISAGKATTSISGNAVVHGACGINTNGILTITDDATVIAEHASAGAAVAVWAGADVTIDGGTIQGGAYGVSGNGSSDGTTIVINGGDISGEGAGVFHPQAGTLTISGGKISGSVGVQMCDGELVVSDAAEIIANGADERADKTGDGAILDGAAISLVKRAGYGEPKAEITGGTFVSERSDAVIMYSWSNNAVGEWTIDGFITGGDFSSNVAAFCPEGYGTAKPESSAFYQVHKHDGNEITKAATCSAPGEKISGCTVDGCSERVVDTIPVDPSAHEWGEWVTTTPAAPGVAGAEQRVCAHDASHVDSRALDALPVIQQPTNGGNGNPQGGATAGVIQAPAAGGLLPAAATAGTPAAATITDDAAPLAAAADEEAIDEDATPLAGELEMGIQDGSFNWLPWVLAAAALLICFFFIILFRRKKDDDEEEQNARVSMR